MSWSREIIRWWDPLDGIWRYRQPHRSGPKNGWFPKDYFSYQDYFIDQARWQQERRRKILDAAAALLAEVGPRRFAVVEVAKRTGIARSTIYKHFGLKAELLAALREDQARGLQPRALAGVTTLKRQQEAQPKLPPTLEPVRQLLLGFADALRRSGDLWLLAGAEAVRCKRRPLTPAPGEPAPFPQVLVQAVADALTSAQQKGALPRGADPQQTARWLCGLWWFELTMQGPQADASPYRPGQRPGLGTAIAWLLAGAGAGAA